MKVDLLRRDFKTDRAEQVGNAFAAFHGFLQAAREKLDVFLVGFEREFSFREMLGQRFVVVVDQLDKARLSFNRISGSTTTLNGVAPGSGLASSFFSAV